MPSSLFRFGAACSALAFVLQGCGKSENNPTPVPTSTEKPSPVEGCLTGGPIQAGDCCCMSCASDPYGNPVFSIDSEANCTEIGGQCKDLSVTSSYMRPPPASLLSAPSVAGVPEQFHLIGGAPEEVTLVFMLGTNMTSQTVQLFNLDEGGAPTSFGTTASSYSVFQYPNGFNGYGTSSRGQEYGPCVKDKPYMNAAPQYMNTTCYYTSDVIHKAQLTGLTPGARYEYRVAGVSGRAFSMPPAISSPIQIGFTADLGQTTDSNSTMSFMKEFLDAGLIDIVVFPGDLSYADGYAPGWDNYGKLGDYLWGIVPTAYGIGNHEYTNGFENFASFIPRYGWPNLAASSTSSPLWFSYEAGLAHIIMLCSYCDFGTSSQQYKWLEKDLKSVDRRKTPWLIANWHTPWYTSSALHSMTESQNMRAAMEELIHQYQVDLVVSGHVHAYERTGAVYKNKTDACGAIYITIGDGGNQEGPACPWEPYPLLWSKRKEYSFGFGLLNITNSTAAQWLWHRNQDSVAVNSDSAWLQPTPVRCAGSTATIFA